MNDPDEQETSPNDVVAFALAVTVPTDREGVDAVKFAEQVISDALSGWGMAVVRIEHLAEPADVFAKAGEQS